MASGLWGMDWQSSEGLSRVERGEVVVDLQRIRGTTTRRGNAVGIIDAPIEQVWAVLNDYNHYTEFMPRFRECFMVKSEVLDKIAEIANLRTAEPILRANMQDIAVSDTIYLYNCLDFPLPLGDKRYILRTVHDNVNYTTRWTQIRGDLRANEGSWELFSRGEKTLAVYTALSDPGIPLPKFLVNMATQLILPDVIKGIRARVKEKNH
jgi:hypothetical protein